MLHRALQQFLADVYWGDLDVLLLDLPPGTGDVAISVAQLVPNAEILVVTTPQLAAAEVAERAGAIATQTAPAGGRRDREHVLAGVPDGDADGDLRLRRRRGVAESLTRRSARRCRCSARSRSTPGCARPATRPPDRAHRAGCRPRRRPSDAVADRLAVRRESLVGKPLGLRPAAG